MQNAKCKIDEAFRLRESLFHGNVLHMDIRKAYAHKRIFKENFSRFSLSRSLILHFAFCTLHFGLCPTNPNLPFYPAAVPLPMSSPKANTKVTEQMDTAAAM